MSFVNTHFNYLFLVLAGLIVFLIMSLKKKTALLEGFADKKSLQSLAAAYSKKKDNIKTILIIVAAFFLILAILRPQWGFVWEEVDHKSVDVMIAVDVSKSMLTKDILPNRLERTKLALEDLVSQLKGDRIGLIAFAGSAFVQCPMTIDYNGFLLAVNDLNTQLIPMPGTNIQSAIEEAIKSVGQGSQGINRTLIIITDGETHSGDALKAAEQAQAANITIHTIGVGTTAGELIEIEEEGTKTYLKDNRGQIVKSRLNEKALQEIAFKGKGTYIKSTPAHFGLDTLYNNKIMDLEKAKMKSSIEKRSIERFQLPLFIAFILLFIEPFISTRKKYEE